MCCVLLTPFRVPAFFLAGMVLTQGCRLQILCPFSFQLGLTSFMWSQTSYTHVMIDHLYGWDPWDNYPVQSSPSWILSLLCDVRTMRLPSSAFLRCHLRMFPQPQPIHVAALDISIHSCPFRKVKLLQAEGPYWISFYCLGSPFLELWV